MSTALPAGDMNDLGSSFDLNKLAKMSVMVGLEYTSPIRDAM